MLMCDIMKKALTDIKILISAGAFCVALKE